MVSQAPANLGQPAQPNGNPLASLPGTGAGAAAKIGECGLGSDCGCAQADAGRLPTAVSLNQIAATPPAARLTALKPGQSGVVVDAAMDDDDAAQLRAMGLRPNARVVLCRSGEPCIVRVLGACGCESRIGLARPLAERVMVNPAAPESNGAPETPSPAPR